jgi:hypothetical protein
MIAELATDLLTKLNTVSSLQGRIGMTFLGGPIDPSGQNVPLPAAWVVFQDETTKRSGEVGFRQEDLTLTFSVLVSVSYTSQSDLLNSQLPTLEAIRSAISGQEVNGANTVGGNRWKYQSTALYEVSNDRLIYEQRYAISGSTQVQSF